MGLEPGSGRAAARLLRALALRARAQGARAMADRVKAIGYKPTAPKVTKDDAINQVRQVQYEQELKQYNDRLLSRRSKTHRSEKMQTTPSMRSCRRGGC